MGASLSLRKWGVNIMGLIHIGFSICIILSVAYKVDCYKGDVPTKRFFSSYYHNLKPIRPGKVAWKWSSENRFNPKENSKKNNPPIFKSEEAVNQLLALSEDEMIEKLFRMEMNQAVSLSNLLGHPVLSKSTIR